MTAATVQRTTPRDAIRWPVPKRVRTAVLTVHVLTSVGWIGLDVALGVLVFAPMIDPALTAACYQVLPLLFWPIVVAAALSLVSGAAIGLITRWGLVRHWWVAIKLVLNLGLLVLILLLLWPGLDQAGEHGRALATGALDSSDVPRLFMPPLVSGTLLIVATVLSVAKPRGRVPGRRA